MSRAKMNEINGEKLREAIHKRGITCKMASREMGRSDLYLTQACYTGRLSEASAVLLESLYNIKREEYQTAMPVEIPAAETVDAGCLAAKIEELTNEVKAWKAVQSKVLYTAAKSAIIDGLEAGSCVILSNVIYEAVKAAMMDALRGDDNEQ